MVISAMIIKTKCFRSEKVKLIDIHSSNEERYKVNFLDKFIFESVRLTGILYFGNQGGDPFVSWFCIS